jgi:hypothetical protein
VGGRRGEGWVGWGGRERERAREDRGVNEGGEGEGKTRPNTWRESVRDVDSGREAGRQGGRDREREGGTGGREGERERAREGGSRDSGREEGREGGRGGGTESVRARVCVSEGVSENPASSADPQYYPHRTCPKDPYTKGPLHQSHTLEGLGLGFRV